MSEDNNLAAYEYLFDALVTGSSSDAIIRQEQREHDKFSQEETLPREMKNCTQEDLEAMGITFYDNADDLFVYVTLPIGWYKKKEDNHNSYWTNLHDEQGRKRASMFYKGAFYDRAAHLFLSRRYSYAVRPVGGWDGFDWNTRSIHPRETVVLDCNKVIWKSSSLIPSEDAPIYDIDERLDIQGERWINEHYPDWRDLLAYWDNKEVENE